MGMATMNGVELYIEQRGDGDLLVLTHGSWTDSRTWREIVEPLAERFRVVTWDRRGHSRSARGDGPAGWDRQTEDLACLVEHLGGPVHLVGNSSGGALVLRLAAARPDLVATVAVHEPGLFGLIRNSHGPAVDREIEEIRRVVSMIESGEHRHAAEAFVGRAIGPGAWQMLDPDLQQTLIDNAPSFVDESTEPFDPDSIDVTVLSQEAAPLLVTWGSESPPLEQAAALELTRRVPRAHTAVLAGAGHTPHRTHPAEWVATLLGFYDRTADDEARSRR